MEVFQDEADDGSTVIDCRDQFSTVTPLGEIFVLDRLDARK